MASRTWFTRPTMVLLFCLGCDSGPQTSPDYGAVAAAGAAGAAGNNDQTAAGTGGVAGMQGSAAGSSGSGGANAGVGGEQAPAPQVDGGSPVTPDGSTMGEPTSGGFPPSDDYAVTGPYATTTLTNTGPAGTYTVYMPTDPAPAAAGNPIVGWMSGGSTDPSWYSLLPHLASHGFVVVASNSVPGIGQETSLGPEIIAGIEWAIAENGRDGSPLFGRLDTEHVASAGYSMGSLSTFVIADNPLLTTTVHISGGNMDPARIKNLRAPAAFICGTPGDAACNILSTDCDIAAANCDLDFQAATTPVFYANFEGGHLGILTSPMMERISGMTTTWLRSQLMGDTLLAQRFAGQDCDYCKDASWKVQQKNLDAAF